MYTDNSKGNGRKKLTFSFQTDPQQRSINSDIKRASAKEGPVVVHHSVVQ